MSVDIAEDAVEYLLEDSKDVFLLHIRFQDNFQMDMVEFGYGKLVYYIPFLVEPARVRIVVYWVAGLETVTSSSSSSSTGCQVATI